MRNDMTPSQPTTRDDKCGLFAPELRLWARSRPSPNVYTPLRARSRSHSLRIGGGRPATVSPQAQNEWSGPLFRRSLALAPCPHPVSVLVGRLHILGPRRAADRFALLRGFGLVPAAIAALLARASGAPLLRPPPCGGLRAPRPRPPVSGIRSAGPRSLRFAPVAGARSGASPLLPRVRPAARAAFSRRPCRSAPAAPLLRLASLAAPRIYIRHRPTHRELYL